MIAIRELFAEVLLDAEAGAAVADADGMLLLVAVMLEVVDETVVEVDVVELATVDVVELATVDVDEDEVIEVELIAVTKGSPTVVDEPPFSKIRETNVNSLSAPSAIFDICKTCSSSGFTSRENMVVGTASELESRVASRPENSCKLEVLVVQSKQTPYIEPPVVFKPT